MSSWGCCLRPVPLGLAESHMVASVGVFACLTSTLDGNVGVGGVGVRQENNFKAVQARTLSVQLFPKTAAPSLSWLLRPSL